MRTDKQNEASRRNGARSKGPVTPEGKARSSQNAVTHGMSSTNVVLDSESPKVYAKFASEITLELKPVGLREEMLVSNFIQARWRMIRILELETTALDCEMESQEAAIKRKYEYIDIVSRTALAFNSLFAGGPNAVGSQYGRYEARLHRIMDKSLKELDRLQALRLKTAGESTSQAGRAASQAARGSQPRSEEPKPQQESSSPSGSASPANSNAKNDKTNPSPSLPPHPPANLERPSKGPFLTPLSPKPDLPSQDSA